MSLTKITSAGFAFDRSVCALTGSTKITFPPCSICTLACPSAVMVMSPPLAGMLVVDGACARASDVAAVNINAAAITRQFMFVPLPSRCHCVHVAPPLRAAPCGGHYAGLKACATRGRYRLARRRPCGNLATAGARRRSAHEDLAPVEIFHEHANTLRLAGLGLIAEELDLRA